MLELATQNKLRFVLIHAIIGFLATVGGFSKLYMIIVSLLSILVVYNSKNIKEEALMFSFYIVGMEVFVRMTHGSLVYETGKYLVILLLLIGFLQERRSKRINFFYLLYFLLLLIGIILTKVPEGESIRKSILFNLSGPFSLGMAALYFYKREIKLSKLLDGLFFAIMPLISMIVYLYFRTPDLREIVFGSNANFTASGGFGPNQVATAIGFGIFIIAVFLLLKKSISGYLWLDFFLLFYFIYRGLLTFSRGGILTGIIAICIFAFFFIISQKNAIKFAFKYISIGLVFSVATWIYTSDITGGMLNNRYTNKSSKGIQKKDISTGRLDILSTQFSNFLDKPFGIGVGNGKYQRVHSGRNVTAASHNEIGRLVEEHGIVGFVIFLGLITIPMINFFDSTNFNRAFIIAFFIFWFLTINHSAMRIAFPGFIYGLSLIKIRNREHHV